MAHPKSNYFQRRSKPQGPKFNERIRALDVQVINSDGQNLGAMPLNKAIELAKQEGLDLIEISPNANPPVCKIMDMGKYKYDLQKKANQAKKKQKTVSLKEIKLRPGTETHDYNFKIKNAKKFISKGDKVKFTVDPSPEKESLDIVEDPPPPPGTSPQPEARRRGRHRRPQDRGERRRAHLPGG